jgi:hypothetical protein
LVRRCVAFGNTTRLPRAFTACSCTSICAIQVPAALGNTVGVVAKFYSHEWSKVRQGRTDKAIKAAW